MATGGVCSAHVPVRDSVWPCHECMSVVRTHRMLRIAHCDCVIMWNPSRSYFGKRDSAACSAGSPAGYPSLPNRPLIGRESPKGPTWPIYRLSAVNAAPCWVHRPSALSRHVVDGGVDQHRAVPGDGELPDIS